MSISTLAILAPVGAAALYFLIVLAQGASVRTALIFGLFVGLIYQSAVAPALAELWELPRTPVPYSGLANS